MNETGSGFKILLGITVIILSSDSALKNVSLPVSNLHLLSIHDIWYVYRLLCFLNVLLKGCLSGYDCNVEGRWEKGYGPFVNKYWQGKTEAPEQNSVLLPLHPPHITHGLPGIEPETIKEKAKPLDGLETCIQNGINWSYIYLLIVICLVITICTKCDGLQASQTVRARNRILLAISHQLR
jgi:hypothetical protein